MYLYMYLYICIYIIFIMVDYNTLKRLQLEKYVTVKYINELNTINNNTSYNYIINLFGNTINTADIVNKSYTYYDNSIRSNSLFVDYFYVTTNNYIYFNDFHAFIDMYVIINIIFINYFDIIISNNVRNIINLNVNIDDYILVVNLCDKYNINISNIIKHINSISDINKIELNINYDIYKQSTEMNGVLGCFVALLNKIPIVSNNYIYHETIKKFLIKLNNKSINIIDNLLVKIHNNNIVYEIYKNDFSKLFDDYILNKAFKQNHVDHIKTIRVAAESSDESTYNIEFKNIKYYMNFNKRINIHKFNTFIYNFNRYKELNNLIPENITLTKECDLIKILCIKPKLLFEKITTDIYYELYYTKKREDIVLIKNLMKLSFHILYCMLNKDIESFMLNKKHNFNIINSESPYIHKLSNIGKHLTTHHILSYYNVYRYVEPITYGYCINLNIKSNNEETSTKKININYIDDIQIKENSLLTPMRSPTLYNSPVNNYIIAYNALIEYTHGIFCKNFNYHPNYRPDKYDRKTPKILLTGSMVGEYCLSSFKNKKAFESSDIDIGVVDSYLIYHVKQNIITNLNLLNNYNISLYKQTIYKVLNHKIKQIKNQKNNNLISKILSYIVEPNLNVKYDLIFPTAESKIIYSNINTEVNCNRVLNNVHVKYNIDNDNIKKNINSFLFKNYDYIQNIKVCLNNIYYYSSSYTLTKYRDIDIYISSLTKICLYHEPIVRSCFTNGEFLIFSDCLNAIITRTSFDYRAVLGKKTPIDIMLKKHKQCVAHRILSNKRKLIDFITGVALSREIYITSETLSDIIICINKVKKNKLIEINIDNYYIITIYTCYL